MKEVTPGATIQRSKVSQKWVTVESSGDCGQLETMPGMRWKPSPPLELDVTMKEPGDLPPLP